MQKFTLRNTKGEELYSTEAASFSECLQSAVKEQADLPELDLSGKTIENVDLSGAVLHGVQAQKSVFKNVKLDGADLSPTPRSSRYLTPHRTVSKMAKAKFSNVSMDGANLGNITGPVIMDGCKLDNANLEHAGLEESKITNSSMNNANVRRADLCNASFKRVSALGTNFAHAGQLNRKTVISDRAYKASFVGVTFENPSVAEHLGIVGGKVSSPEFENPSERSLFDRNNNIVYTTSANDISSCLEKAVKDNVNLDNVDLQEQKLENIDISGVQMPNANLENTSFKSVKMTDADLSWKRDGSLMSNSMNSKKLPRLKGTKFVDTDLTGANMENANADNMQVKRGSFADVSLNGANIKHSKISNTSVCGTNFEAAKKLDGNYHTAFGVHKKTGALKLSNVTFDNEAQARMLASKGVKISSPAFAKEGYKAFSSGKQALDSTGETAHKLPQSTANRFVANSKVSNTAQATLKHKLDSLRQR